MSIWRSDIKLLPLLLLRNGGANFLRSFFFVLRFVFFFFFFYCNRIRFAHFEWSLFVAHFRSWNVLMHRFVVIVFFGIFIVRDHRISMLIGSENDTSNRVLSLLYEYLSDIPFNVLHKYKCVRFFLLFFKFVWRK